jgi:hypothetical protein
MQKANGFRSDFVGTNPCGSYYKNALGISGRNRSGSILRSQDTDHLFKDAAVRGDDLLAIN